MTARLNLLLKRIKAEISKGKTFEEAIAGYLLTAKETEELRAAMM